MYRWLLPIILFSFPVFAKKDQIEVSLENNPIKSSYAIFMFDVPTGYEIDKAKIIVKSGKIEYKFLTDDIQLEKKSGSIFGKIKVSNLEPGDYEVKIKVRDIKSKNENFIQCRHKGVLKDNLTMTIDSSLQVADPGDEGKKTLLGIDTDRNGVRDDVQRWINEDFSNKPKTKSTLQDLARSLQDILKNYQNKSVTITKIKQSLLIQSCFGFKLKEESDDKTLELKTLKTITVLMNNTKERIIADNQANDAFHGQSVEVPMTKEKACIGAVE